MTLARASLAALLLAVSGAHAQTTLRFAQLVPPTHPYHAGILVPWTAEVEKVTGGRVKVEITTAPLGPMSRNFDMVHQGIADMAGGNHLLSPGRFAVTQIVQGYVGNSVPEAVSVAFWRTHKRYLEKAVTEEHDGTHVLSLHVSGSLHVFATQKEIRSVADVKGLKFLTPGAIVGRMAGNLGAVPITRAVPEYYDAVSKGIVDGVWGTNSAVNGFKVEPLIRHHLELPGGLHFSSFFLVVNKAKWDALPQQDRDAIDRIGGEAYARLAGQVLGKQEQDILAARKKEGRVRTVVADAATGAAFRKALDFFDQEWIAGAKAKGIDGDAAMRYFREQATSYQAK